jgi:hypothetical protein
MAAQRMTKAKTERPQSCRIQERNRQKTVNARNSGSLTSRKPHRLTMETENKVAVQKDRRMKIPSMTREDIANLSPDHGLFDWRRVKDVHGIQRCRQPLPPSSVSKSPDFTGPC